MLWATLNLCCIYSVIVNCETHMRPSEETHNMNHTFSSILHNDQIHSYSLQDKIIDVIVYFQETCTVVFITIIGNCGLL